MQATSTISTNSFIIRKLWNTFINSDLSVLIEGQISELVLLLFKLIPRQLGQYHLEILHNNWPIEQYF